jgi:hypothetical protein
MGSAHLPLATGDGAMIGTRQSAHASITAMKRTAFAYASVTARRAPTWASILRAACVPPLANIFGRVSSFLSSHC